MVVLLVLLPAVAFAPVHGYPALFVGRIVSRELVGLPV
jgi:hypothetical protein